MVTVIRFLFLYVVGVYSWEFQERFSCGVCNEVLEGAACEKFDACHAINASVLAEGCEAVCNNAPLPTNPTRSVAPELRVTKGFGTKPYDQLRISVISSVASPPVDGFFDYSAQFKHRWTDNFLHTAMKEVQPGVPTQLNIGEIVTVKLPLQGQGVAGVLIADPCTNGKWIGCAYVNIHQTNTRIPGLINAFVADASTDFWSIYGDNFYDRTGEITKDVYDRISIQAKSKIFTTVPGNHDYWVFGGPPGDQFQDQCANAHMQYYAQDAKAAENVGVGSTAAPFDLSIDPGSVHGKCSLPVMTNSFWYNQVGNLGMVGMSGAYSLDEARGFMAESCIWLSQQPGVDVALLVGHWDVSGLGASNEMAMPAWYTEMSPLPGCAEFNQRGMLKFVMGHTHCNQPHPHGHVGTGFMVAGFGMGGCGNFGMPIIDTTEGRLRFWYFDTSNKAKYDAAVACAQEKGWRQCLDLATSWLDEAIVPGPAPHPTPPVPPSPPTPSSWEKHADTNCYQGHGAVSVPGDAGAYGMLSLAACEAACQKSSDCSGIIMAQTADPQQAVNCWRIASIVLSQCLPDKMYNLWLSPSTPTPPPPPSWSAHQNTNCYQFHGANAVPGDVGPYAKVNLADCEAACKKHNSCTGIVMEQTPDPQVSVKCWRIMHVDLSHCVSTPAFNVWTVAGSPSVAQVNATSVIVV